MLAINTAHTTIKMTTHVTPDEPDTGSEARDLDYHHGAVQRHVAKLRYSRTCLDLTIVSMLFSKDVVSED